MHTQSQSTPRSAGGGGGQILAETLRRQAHACRDRTAFVFGERRTSYSSLDELTNRVAQALAAAGCEPGARAAVLAGDSDHVYEVIGGCAKAGVVSLGINWRLAPPEIRFILEDSGARVLFVDAEFYSKVAAAIGDLEGLATVVVLEGAVEGLTAYAAWRDAAPAIDPCLTQSADDPVVQMYTSGTTGLPKGVVLANRSFFAVVDAMAAAGDGWIGWRGDDVSLLNIPSFHIGGLWWAMTGLNAGATGVILRAFNPGQVIDQVQRHRVTKVCMVPAMMQMVLAEPAAASADWSSLEAIVYGGSPIPRTLLERAMDTFGCEFAQIYGLTETGNTAVCLRHADHLDPSGERLKAAGRPYPGVRVEIIDREGRALPPREVGEIRVHSPANMLGYWNRPEATEATLRDGWVYTGDAGYLDEQGFVFVHDRVKDMIIYAGENVYPAEIESVLCAHPDVVEAAVIGVPDERWGEAVKAIVVRREGSDLRARALLAHARASLADFKVPKTVDWIDALPRTPSGKIKKAQLRTPYWEGRERQVN
ncbi:long-chain-fatty-acid--CoA ligase [Engelhardtia mirabilis]|uniref:Long-chain-fatty-acid--CoA ligase FadD13 n=1 Tax=Engelhardtia mirabilis TaxID=2528011 RepID=A0A518BEN8_9BACT|nr:Long-chain-fatty-acid--CoA ligase FadD13 [Planctomycetes bacterium Pla133]QDU99780.1 Long-chain-fatty-acid--CoA ligase FadD13 [Planctomycetes bacterium Pla86]